MPPAAAQKAVPLPAAPSAAAVLGLDPKAPTPATPAQAQPTPLHSSRVPDLEPFFRGARVSARVPPQQVDAFLFRLGQVMRAVMIGITGGLSSCAEQKNALRLPSTTSEPQHNNPLKHSAGADKAFASLLLADSSSHLAPVDAVREAFEELQLHQQLMLKALRSAVDAFVARLDPDELEQKFARGRANVLVNAANRLKYWEFYKDLYDVVAHHPPGELPLQFVEDFTEAYGRELARTSDAPAETPEKRQAV